ncbi:hypothetical protein ACN20G_31495 (plasmid) [Streptomyces sp. BI20]|uniref:hypothetical protein n=1 Tax=Streptomyces sp. BI20 TaxID=3403460 RepID=UPI003C783538
MSTVTDPAGPRTTPAPAGDPTPPARAGAAGLLRVTWRLHRPALIGVVLLPFAVVLLQLAYRWSIDPEYGFWFDCATGARTDCPDFRNEDPYTGQTLVLYRLFQISALALTALPAVIGALVAGPMIGREIESGTHRLHWTQSVAPASWLRAKLLVACAAAVLAVVPAGLLHRAAWLLQPGFNPRWYEWEVYPVIGPVPVAYALFGVGLGALTALALGRALPAVAATVGGWALLLGALSVARPWLWPAERVDPIDSCCVQVFPLSRRMPEDLLHPDAHLVPLQLVEAGIVLALAALALLLSFRFLRRRHG